MIIANINDSASKSDNEKQEKEEGMNEFVSFLDRLKGMDGVKDTKTGTVHSGYV